ncbi:PAS domain-containing sensor histidine kinase [Psychrosphaera aestuarii]|uniref:PAS domain-containing sensor histidine kinase n=1 Tax=Psychrosphaera aestuarii TaxID=1266052 RepID=UPI001B332694|nr:PAS domain S-box protein [Psychrosphaera aestuarii]
MNSNTLESFFYNEYMPHGHCYMWQPHILWTNVVADLLIALAYFSIPIALLIFAHKRPDIGYKKVVWLFSSFILFCGITHLFGIITIWQGIYGWHGVMKSFTAVVSISTAIYLYRILPALVTISTPEQVEDIKQSLSNVTTEKEQLYLQVEQQKLVQFMIDTMPIGACLLGKEYEILLCNDTFCSETGFNKEQALAIKLEGLLAPDDPSNLDFLSKLNNKNTLFSDKDKLQTILQFKNRFGNVFPAEVSLVKKQFDQQHYYIFTLQNLTEIEEVKRQLIESHKKLERAINAAEDGIWEYHIPSKQMTWSDKFAELIGANDHLEESLENWKQHIHPDQLKIVETQLNSLFNKKERFSIEYLGKNSSGEYGWFNFIGKSIFDDNNVPISMSGSLRYIQDSKALKQQVAEKTELLNAIYEGANNAIWVVSVEDTEQFRFLTFNRAASERLNAPSEQVAGKLLTELSGTVLSADIVEKLNHHFQSCVDIKSVSEYSEMIPYKGKNCWYFTSLYPILNADNDVVRIVGSSIDITSQKEVEQQLSDNKNFLENIIDASICGISLFDLTQQNVVRVNQRYTDILGYTLEDLRNAQDKLSIYHPDDLVDISNQIELVIQSPVNASLSNKHRYRHKNGGWRWCSTNTTIIKRDIYNNPLIMLTTFIDITEQLELMEKLQESNAYLERFAMVASHDLQEPLRKISAFSDMLSERLTTDYELDEDSEFQLSRIRDAAGRMRVMVSDILGLSQINSMAIQKTVFSLNDVVNAATDQLQMAIEDSEANIIIENGEETINADKSLLIQLLQNLISNSIKFKSDQSPIITISIQNSAYLTIINIKDNGIGMESKYCTQIFEPFRRLHGKDKYKGSGIGLAICQQICKVHGGKIECQSELSQGTNFKVTLTK